MTTSSDDFKSLKSLVEPGIADALGLLGIPTATLRKIFDRIRHDRLQRASQILLDELRKGNITPDSAMENLAAAQNIIDYMRAAISGAAEANLRILAQLIKGTVVEPPEEARPRFYRFSQTISMLTQDELVVLAALYRNRRPLSDAILNGSTSEKKPFQKTLVELVPARYPTIVAVSSLAGMLTRTGLVVALSGFGSLVYETTPLMDELARYVIIEEVIGSYSDDKA